MTLSKQAAVACNHNQLLMRLPPSLSDMSMWHEPQSMSNHMDMPSPACAHLAIQRRLLVVYLGCPTSKMYIIADLRSFSPFFKLSSPSSVVHASR